MTTPKKQTRDRRDLPNYSVAEAARWLGLRQGRIRAWLAGQSRMQPIVTPATRQPLGLSFWNLVECSVLGSIRDEHRVSLQKVRKALRYVARELGRERPLIQQEFSTDGVHLFVERYGSLVSASEEGQTAMREILEAGLKRIERDRRGLAARLFPWHVDPREPRLVAVDPCVSFGRPVLVETRIPIEVIFERFEAGETIAHLAKDYGASPGVIEDVIRKWFGATAA